MPTIPSFEVPPATGHLRSELATVEKVSRPCDVKISQFELPQKNGQEKRTLMPRVLLRFTQEKTKMRDLKRHILVCTDSRQPALLPHRYGQPRVRCTNCGDGAWNPLLREVWSPVSFMRDCQPSHPVPLASTEGSNPRRNTGYDTHKRATWDDLSMQHETTTNRLQRSCSRCVHSTPARSTSSCRVIRSSPSPLKNILFVYGC